MSETTKEQVEKLQLEIKELKRQNDSLIYRNDRLMADFRNDYGETLCDACDKDIEHGEHYDVIKSERDSLRDVVFKTEEIINEKDREIESLRAQRYEYYAKSEQFKIEIKTLKEQLAEAEKILNFAKDAHKVNIDTFIDVRTYCSRYFAKKEKQDKENKGWKMINRTKSGISIDTILDDAQVLKEKLWVILDTIGDSITTRDTKDSMNNLLDNINTIKNYIEKQ